MKYMDRSAVISYHLNRLGREDWYAQGWFSKQSQEIRFAQFLNALQFDNSSVLDLGCGYGDFFSFLIHHDLTVRYTGVDLIPSFIESAQMRFHKRNDATWICADCTEGSLPKADIIVASGTLNYQTGMTDHPFRLIRTMWESCTTAVAFNLLDSRSFTDTSRLKSWNAEEVLGYCRKLTPNAQLISGYLPHDFTIVMKKSADQ